MNAPTFQQRTFTSGDGLSLYYRDYGRRPSPLTPVLCLAGLTRNSHDFHRLALRLSTSRRVVCPDYRGRGRSEYDADWRHYLPETYLDDIRHLLCAADLDRVIVVGTSLGGILCAAMSVAQPRAIAGAVINDVGPEVGSDGLGRIIAYLSDNRAHADWAEAVAHLRTVLPDAAPQNDDEWLELAKGTYRTCADGKLRFDWDPGLLKPFAAGRAAADLWPLFRALRGRPLLLVRGECSKVLHQDVFERYGAEIPDAASITVPRVGHVPSLGEPICRDGVDALLARIDAQEPSGA